MDIELKLEPGRKEPKLVVLAGEDSPRVQTLLRELQAMTCSPVSVWQGERSVILPQHEFLRFYTENKGVSAQTKDGVFETKLRLYELEELLDPQRFVRISNSEIVNFRRVTAVDLSMTGTICMTLEGGIRTYVSRRYVKKIKETLKSKGRNRP